MNPDKNQLEELFYETCEDFLLPIVKALDKLDEINQWYLWKPKALILQFYKILNAMTYRLAEAKEANKNNDDPMSFPLSDVKVMAVRSMICCAFVVTFGVSLSSELKASFEDVFKPYKNLFGINVNSSSMSMPRIFDLYYDVTTLRWDII